MRPGSPGAWRCQPAVVDVEEMIAVANVALLSAAIRYRPAEHDGTPFSAYARKRIRGAVKDCVRAVLHDGTGGRGLKPRLLSITADPMDTHAGDDPALNAVATQPVAPQRIDQVREVRRVREAASWLPPLQRRVLAAFYTDAEPSLVDVAYKLQITHSKAKETHAAAIVALRTRLKKAA